MTTSPVHTARTSSCSRRILRESRFTMRDCPSVPKEAIPPTNLPRLGILGISMSRKIFQNESGLSVCSEHGNKRETTGSIETNAGTASYGARKLLWCSHDLELASTAFHNFLCPRCFPELLCALHVSNNNKSSRLSRVILAANSLNSKSLLDTTSAVKNVSHSDRPCEYDHMKLTDGLGVA